MKNTRNCNSNYPVYPQMGGMVPPYGAPMMPNYNYNDLGNTQQTQQINNLEQQVNMLEQRVTRLENMNNANGQNYNKYNDSNYYMV